MFYIYNFFVFLNLIDFFEFLTHLNFINQNNRKNGYISSIKNSLQVHNGFLSVGYTVFKTLFLSVKSYNFFFKLSNLKN